MKTVTYRLFLEQPLLATSLDGDPNSSRSFDFVPGSQLRGLLIHRHRQSEGLPAGNFLSDPVVQRRFFSGATRFLHAYPLLADERRALPTPLALRRPKGASSKIGYKALNLAHLDGRKQLDEAGPLTQFQPLGEPFCGPAGRDGVRMSSPEHTIAIHIQRNRAYGRARREDGEVFRYDALAAGQWFAGAVLCDEDDDAEAIEALLAANPIAWVGRSRSAQYGRIRFDSIETVQEWREARGGRVAVGEPLVMMLLSDLLLRDAGGRELGVPDDGAFSAALGLAVEHVPAASFTTATLAGSFNATARLPGVQRHALRAGSVVTLRLRDEIAADTLADRLAAVTWAGLGERRSEGYGRVTFNWLQEPSLEVSRATSFAPPADASLTLSAAGARIAALMAARLFQGQIDAGIARFVRDEVIDRLGVVANMPSSSQLGRVRVLIRRALPTGDLVSVRAGLEGMKQAAQGQFDRARLAGKPLDRWLAELLADPSADTVPAWTMLNVSPSTQLVANTAAPSDPLLARVTALRLAEAVLAAAARQRRREVVQ